MKTYSVLVVLTMAINISLSAALHAADDAAAGWASDWAVRENFSIQIDTEGYHFPTAIAFVPNPGTGPKDPLYFITEIRGTIKVVTNDRSVHVFASNFFSLEPEAELPDNKGETGLAGICLDPTHGYLFVTYAYQDRDGVLRNNITRFETAPRTFSTQPTGRLDFTDLFSGDETTFSHQIGPCQVEGDSLYIGVGDGHNHVLSRSIDSTLGKILRVTLDGEPHPDNPFHRRGEEPKVASYVWAYGLRNPFSLELVNGRVFVADNGPNVDRFLEVHEGENYFWDGTDWSIGLRADMTISPAVGPVQMEYHSEDRDLFPREHRDRFYIATAGVTTRRGSTRYGEKSILTVPYDFAAGEVARVPEIFLKYQGNERQVIAGLGFGPDGLYFVPVLPDSQGRSAVLKVLHRPERQHPFLIGQSEPLTLIGRYGCLGCHTLDGTGNDVGPALDQESLVPRIASRLDSEEYGETLARLERSGFAPLRESREAVTEILELDGAERVRAWMVQHIQNPGFDNPASQMPDLGLSRAEAAAITDHLVPHREGLAALVADVKAVIGPVGYRKLAMALVVGFVIGAASIASLWLLARLVRRSRGRGARRSATPLAGRPVT